ncbi:MAG: hypothetical protein LBJ00_17180 [Planctomycetaceae bacterium]|nr:hypothetical protein [Planctomycetaceae bacterium]
MKLKVKVKVKTETDDGLIGATFTVAPSGLKSVSFVNRSWHTNLNRRTPTKVQFPAIPKTSLLSKRSK